MYEHRKDRLLPRPVFFRRLMAHGGLAIALVAISWMVGVVGYRTLAGLSWMDSLLNAAMILAGEGPVDRLDSNAAKLFASLYSLYSGFILLVSVGIIFTPVLHRLIHSFHLADDR